jgi:hypothetical protein
MNVITSLNAVCLYPLETLVQMRSMVTRDLHPNQRAAAHKYRSRGWEIHGPLCAHRLDQLPYHWGQLRRVGDDRSLVVPLDRDRATEEEPIMINTWQLNLDYQAPSFVQIEQTLEDECLAFQYTAGNRTAEMSLECAIDYLKAKAGLSSANSQ